jgi:hypothetical protein
LGAQKKAAGKPAAFYWKYSPFANARNNPGPGLAYAEGTTTKDGSWRKQLRYAQG